MRNIGVRVLSLLLLSSTKLMAQPVQTEVVFSPLNHKHPLNIKESHCLKTKKNNVGMTDCASFAIQGWDQEINRLYDTLMATLKPEFQQELKESQNAWLKLKEKEFVFYDNYIGRKQGSIWPYISLTFKRDFIKNRAEVLYHSAHPEEDLTEKPAE